MDPLPPCGLNKVNVPASWLSKQPTRGRLNRSRLGLKCAQDARRDCWVSPSEF